MSKVAVDITLKSSNVDMIISASDEAIETALELIGMQAEGYAVGICPVDTGRLRNSITHEVDGHTVAIGSNVEYAAYVELGTSRQEPQPYLGPAVEDHVDEYREILESQLKT